MIYHYTDLNAAKSIAENAQVWLTDYRYLNDKEEFSRGYEVLLDALDFYKDLEGKYPDEFMDEIAKAIAFIRTDTFQSVERNKIFVSSFSLIPDLLGQWRNYGMYCLAMDEDFFRDDEIEVLNCHYLQDYADALEYATLLIEESIFPILIDAWEKRPFFLCAELSSLIDIYALSFKHEAFSEENEIRFVLSCSPDDERISFRVRGNLLIPYIQFAFDPLLLKSITVGPIDNQELAVDSLTMFTTKFSREIQESSDNFEYFLDAECSDIPFRNI